MNRLTQEPPDADLARLPARPSPAQTPLVTGRLARTQVPPDVPIRRPAVYLLIGAVALGLLGLLALSLFTTRPGAISGTAGSISGTAGDIVAEGAWGRAAIRPADGADGTSAIYMVLRNGGSQQDRLIGATSDVAMTTEIHRTTMEDGVMRMRPAGPVDVPAGDTVTLQPGGLHVMLIGLRHDLVAGERLTVTLRFERAGDLTVDAEIRAPMQSPMHGG